MKRVALISAVVFTAFALQSCRQSDDVFSPEEAATLQRVRDSSNISDLKNNAGILNTQQSNGTASVVDGEIAPPPKK